MIYSESSFGGPDCAGRVWPAYHFAHIAAWDERARLDSIMRRCRAAHERSRRA